MQKQATASYGLSPELLAELSWRRRAVARVAGFFSESVQLEWFGLPSGVVTVGAAAGAHPVREELGQILHELPGGLAWTRGAHLDSGGNIVEELSPGINRPMAWWFIRRRRFYPTVVEEEGTVFSLVGDAAENLYHWSFDVLPRLGLLGPENLARVRVLAPQNRAFHLPSLLAFGFREEQIIAAEAGIFYRADQLWVARIERGVTAVNVEFLRGLYGRIAAEGPAHAAPVRLYISRAKATSRKIVNEEDLEEGLRQRGFHIALFEELPFAEQLAFIAQAEIIVSAHGAAWTLAVVARLGTPVIEILPAGLETEDPASYNLYRNLSREAGLDYRAHHGEAVLHKSETQKTHQNDIRVSVAQLLDEIDGLKR